MFVLKLPIIQFLLPTIHLSIENRLYFLIFEVIILLAIKQMSQYRVIVGIHFLIKCY